MRRFLMVAGLVAALTGLAYAPLSPLNGQANDNAWGPVKGRIIWEGKAPPQTPIKVTVDKLYCMSCAKNNVLLDEECLVNPKNQGLANVVVWIAPLKDGDKLPIHPRLQAIPVKQVAINQPCCKFEPRVVALREGQALVVKNKSAVNHNARLTGNPDINAGAGLSLQAGKDHVLNGLKAQKLPLVIECNIHPWMRGRVAVFDHPYFAITDADGKFEIPMAPNGKYKLYVLHELGWRGGKAGRDGEPITILGGQGVNLGDVVYNVKK